MVDCVCVWFVVLLPSLDHRGLMVDCVFVWFVVLLPSLDHRGLMVDWTRGDLRRSRMLDCDRSLF